MSWILISTLVDPWLGILAAVSWPLGPDPKKGVIFLERSVGGEIRARYGPKIVNKGRDRRDHPLADLGLANNVWCVDTEAR